MSNCSGNEGVPVAAESGNNPNDLRTRIAAVIYAALLSQSNAERFPPTVDTPVGSEDFNGIAYIDGEVDLIWAADAVIRELGWHQESKLIVSLYRKKTQQTRYVTEWKADDE